MHAMESLLRGVFGLAFLALIFVAAIFYILTLSRALEKCSPASRTMQPGMVWLLLIPLFNIVWSFLVVIALGRSLGNEFRLRNLPNPSPEPGKGIGLAMCICGACGIIPLIGLIPSFVGFVLWITYWVRIAEFSRMLDSPALPNFVQGA
ncbi:MAG TPA: hypothetical protein VG844_14535 [Terracidiphilus sp.]|nr:hypothetical protein [Terracidiphilus sp.]